MARFLPSIFFPFQSSRGEPSVWTHSMILEESILEEQKSLPPLQIFYIAGLSKPGCIGLGKHVKMQIPGDLPHRLFRCHGD